MLDSKLAGNSGNVKSDEQLSDIESGVLSRSQNAPQKGDVSPILDTTTVVASATSDKAQKNDQLWEQNRRRSNPYEKRHLGTVPLPEKIKRIKQLNDVFIEDWEPVVLRYFLQSAARDILNHNRLSACMRVPAPRALTVDIHRSEDGTKAHYRNLVRCANVWLCPVCSVSITMKRRQELATALANSWHKFYMVTFTVQHLQSMPLADTLGILLKAYRNFTSGRSYQRLIGELSIVGTLKTLETLYGANGWHPHFHLLYALLDEIDEAELKLLLGERWETKVTRLGGKVNIQKAFDVRKADESVSEYLAKFGHLPQNEKWSLEDEMTRTPSKKGKNHSLSPFEILLGVVNPNIPESVQEWLKGLFLEYQKAMYRKQQLRPNDGMKAALDYEYLPDDEIIQNEALEYPLFAVLSHYEWKKVLYNRVRGELLVLAKEGNETKFWEFMKGLKPVPLREGS